MADALPNSNGSDELVQFRQQLYDDFVAQHGESPQYDADENSDYAKYNKLQTAFYEEAWENKATDKLRKERDKLQAATDQFIDDSKQYTVDRCDINIPNGK